MPGAGVGLGGEKQAFRGVIEAMYPGEGPAGRPPEAPHPGANCEAPRAVDPSSFASVCVS